MSFNLTDFKEWKEIPLEGVSVFYTGNSYGLHYLNKSSSFELKPIFANQKTDTGATRIVAYSIKSKFSPIMNNFADMQELLQKIDSNEEIDHVSFYFAPIQPKGDESMLIMYKKGGSIAMSDSSINYEINLSDTGPEITFNFEGILSKDAFNSTNFEDYIMQGW
jgi:hypothetical protein